MNQIVAFNAEIRMPRQPNSQKEIATFAPPLACFALAGKPNPLTFAYAARDFYLISLHLFRSRPT